MKQTEFAAKLAQNRLLPQKYKATFTTVASQLDRDQRVLLLEEIDLLSERNQDNIDRLEQVLQEIELVEYKRL